MQSQVEMAVAKSERRTYAQACNIAHTLDVVGERWTLLLLRELFTGPRSYSQLAESLSGMGTNLLAARLKQLEGDDMIERERVAGMRKRRIYRLTERGRLIEPVLVEMVRFGLRSGLKGGESDYSRPSWAVLSSRAVFRPDLAAGLNERYEFRVGEEVFYLGVKDDRPDNDSGPAQDPIVVAEMSEETFDRVQSGELKMAQGAWTGEIRVVRGPAAALGRCEQIFGG